MYSYGMHSDSADLQALIAKAESGETDTARNGLRQFIEKHPSTLLAWKWLADVAENARERSDAIRRAQLLAPGDPWVIEAKKYRRPPTRRRRKPKPPTDPANYAAANAAATEIVVMNEVKSETVAARLAGSVNENPPHAGDSTAEENIPVPSGAIQSRQTRWAVWVAAAMGTAGLALLVTAWQLGSF